MGGALLRCRPPEAMRRILIDAPGATRRSPRRDSNAGGHSGNRPRFCNDDDQLLAVNGALDKLAVEHKSSGARKTALLRRHDQRRSGGSPRISTRTAKYY